MEQYTFLRQLADSWALLALFAFLIGVFLWVLRPGATKQYRDTANIPFRNSDRPLVAKDDALTATPKEAGK
ncbi:MAG: cbb3-type cytochrome c oxidase subunit 3 [Rhodobacteraceae bacterium]|nr:cbb3-type cytochrome c oxidase subunit 3 [Paracoccaceae bacterium]